MHQAIDAQVDEHGNIRLLEDVVLPAMSKVVVVVIDTKLICSDNALNTNVVSED